MRLSDGRRIGVRPIRTSDGERLQALHRGLSSNTVYQRFFCWLDELPMAQAERLASVDGIDRRALVAVHDDALVAVARYHRLGPDSRSAEVAFVVADAYQHHGLGTVLVRMLAADAQARGIDGFEADVLTANVAMHHAFSDAGLTALASYDHGVTHLAIALPEAASA